MLVRAEEIVLCDDGTERMVQAATLREYFTRLGHSWFGEVRLAFAQCCATCCLTAAASCSHSSNARAAAAQGVERQVAAFADAMRQVLQVSKLLVFTTSELLESVCGEAVHWDEETVRDCFVSDPIT